MKFTLRDLFWLILLAAVVSLAYRHELSFKRSVELEAIRNNTAVRSELMLQHRLELSQQESRHLKAIRDQATLFRNQERARLNREGAPPRTQYLEMPTALPKDGA